MRQRIRDKRYREGVDKGRMATQTIVLPQRKDYKPKPKEEPKKTIIQNGDEEIHIIEYDALPKQIQKHVMAKILAKSGKNNVKIISK
jgi:hypothetical protein